ncbi:hypothetical protein VPH35_053820 [Triticum aestivum]
MIVHLLFPLNCVFILLIKKHLILWLACCSSATASCAASSRAATMPAPRRRPLPLSTPFAARSRRRRSQSLVAALQVLPPLLPKGKVKEGACVVFLHLAARIVVSNLRKNAKKIKDMYPHYNERSGLLLCGFQT